MKLRIAALVHDIGKHAIPTWLLGKKNPLTEEEKQVIRLHPYIDYKILSLVEFPWPVAQIVYQHHERWDGLGYPQGLSGEQILLEARILAVADTVDAMYSDRPYRPTPGLVKAWRQFQMGERLFLTPR